MNKKKALNKCHNPCGRIAIVAATLAVLIAAQPAHAMTSPDVVWMPANSLQMRQDVEVLADTGILHTPIDAWPLPWAAVMTDLYDVNPKVLTSVELGAWQRLMAEMPGAPACFDTRAAVAVNVQRGEPNRRWFARAPRGKNNVESAIASQCTGFFYALDVSHDNQPLDNGANPNRLDGSYVGIEAGNWLVLAGEDDRWWGSSRSGTMVLDTNARPVPALELTRASAVPFNTRGSPGSVPGASRPSWVN